MSNCKSNHKKKFLAQKGQVAVIIALLIVCLMGMAALVVDVGSLYQKRASFQTVADSAALAGAQELPDSGRAIQVAIEYAARNDVNITSSDVVISSTLAPNDTIKVTLSDPAPVYFAGVLGINTVDVGASATAMVGEPKQVYYLVPWAAIVWVGATNWWDVLVPGTDKQIITYDKTSSKSDFCAWSEDPLPLNWNAVIYPGRIINGCSFPLSVGNTIYVRAISMPITVPPTTTRVGALSDLDWSNLDSFATLTYTVDGVIKLAKSDTQLVIVPVIEKPKKIGDPATIKAFAPFIILSKTGSGTSAKIIGKFIHQALIVNEGDVEAVKSVGLRVIRLIR